MHYEAILFDMDGTLLPMDTEAFTKGYFKLLFAKLAKYGLDPQTFGRNMWDGVAAMVRNDGSRTNEAAFWDCFQKATGLQALDELMADCEAFYGNEFRAAKAFTGENSLATEAVRIAREKAPHVVLATNPLFPMVGQITRMGFVGLTPSDFELVTSYESDSFCKPNPAYFTSVCERIGVAPENCLMIGNDEHEDMHAAAKAGLHGYLVTDCLIPNAEHPWQGDRGTFANLVAMLKALD